MTFAVAWALSNNYLSISERTSVCVVQCFSFSMALCSSRSIVSECSFPPSLWTQKSVPGSAIYLIRRPCFWGISHFSFSSSDMDIVLQWPQGCRCVWLGLVDLIRRPCFWRGEGGSSVTFIFPHRTWTLFCNRRGVVRSYGTCGSDPATLLGLSHFSFSSSDMDIVLQWPQGCRCEKLWFGLELDLWIKSGDLVSGGGGGGGGSVTFCLPHRTWTLFCSGRKGVVISCGPRTCGSDPATLFLGSQPLVYFLIHRTWTSFC